MCPPWLLALIMRLTLQIPKLSSLLWPRGKLNHLKLNLSCKKGIQESVNGVLRENVLSACIVTRLPSHQVPAKGDPLGSTTQHYFSISPLSEPLLEHSWHCSHSSLLNQQGGRRDLSRNCIWARDSWWSMRDYYHSPVTGSSCCCRFLAVLLGQADSGGLRAQPMRTRQSIEGYAWLR